MERHEQKQEGYGVEKKEKEKGRHCIKERKTENDREGEEKR